MAISLSNSVMASLKRWLNSAMGSTTGSCYVGYEGSEASSALEVSWLSTGSTGGNFEGVDEGSVSSGFSPAEEEGREVSAPGGLVAFGSRGTGAVSVSSLVD